MTDALAVTVIMPVKHYCETFLRKAIASVRNQTCSHWHLVIVVEEEDVAEFTALLSSDLQDERVRLVANQGRKLAGSINTGMRYAATEFVAILLGDDMWAPEAVAVLSHSIARYPHVDFFHSARAVINERDEQISSVMLSRETFRIEEFVRASPVKHLLCWRRSKALAIGGVDESLESVGSDDYDFPWTMAENGSVFMAIQECLYLYRNHCEHYRLTTHQPLSVHKRGVAGILKKHGVGVLTRTFIVTLNSLRGGLGGQCLYRDTLGSRIKLKLGLGPKDGWKQQAYR